MTVSIDSMRRRTWPATDAGARIVAHFDFSVAGLRVHECALVRAADDALLIWSPRAVGTRRRGVLSFDSRELRHELREVAWKAYAAMMGAELDWTPSPPRPPREQRS